MIDIERPIAMRRDRFCAKAVIPFVVGCRYRDGVSIEGAADVEVRRSLRRRRTVSAYRDGARIVVLMPARFTRAEEQKWVREMVGRITSREKVASVRGPRRNDATLKARANDLVDLYRSLKNDLPAFNGDPTWTLPMPGRFVIAQDGMILYAEVNPDYTRRPEPEDMLPALRRAANVAA